MADEMAPDESPQELPSAFASIFDSSTLSIIVTLICAYILYRFFRGSSNTDKEDEETFKPLPPPLPKHDMLLEELSTYNGTDKDERVCIGINGKVYDCTKGRRFYGPGGPYAPFAGHDATRALANFDVHAVKDEWDDHADLTASEMSSVQEWEMQFSERYELVGNLVQVLKPVSNVENGDQDET